MSKEEEKKEKVNVWSPKFAGGPKGLGDPEDRTLRHVEEFVYVNNIIQERAHREKCQDLINKWGQCMEENNDGSWRGYLTFITCKKQVDEMNTCLKHYYKDPAFKEECKEIYLAKRKRYRETGIVEKESTHHKPYYQSMWKREFLEKYKAEKEQKQQQDTKNS